MPPPFDPRPSFPTQFPAQPLMDPQSLAMVQRRMLGGVPQGLLDTSNAPAGLLGPSTVRPGAAAGLLTPVIWDRLLRGISPLATTEGARSSYGGGGRGGFNQGGTEGRLTDQYPMDLRGGRGDKPRPPPPPKWRPEWEPGEYSDEHVAKTPSGLQVTMQDRGNGTVDAVFHEPHTSIMETLRSGGSTGRSINRLSEVFTAVKSYVRNFEPAALRFSSASGSHEKLYDRVAPLIADELGGRLRMPEPGVYHIDLSGGGGDE